MKSSLTKDQLKNNPYVISALWNKENLAQK